MKSESRLDSAVFQLTPTRTRCDLVIITNGKREKIASGLLNPFLAHLKAAQDQIAKGGYSITLEPDPSTDTLWFTKGTLERFVRFVSTPEVLERVNTIESEILQIEEAIAIQGNDNLGMSTAEDHQTRPVEYIEGSKSTFDADDEKAIVLYKPGAHPPETNGSTTHEENSKVQLLRVLETRKTVLQKEQGMAFARAVAAGFDMDHMAHLISFAECFGAARLLEACLRFMELWQGKHETGQWLEIEAAETMSLRSDFPSMNASGIMLSGVSTKHKEFKETWPVSNGDVGIESIGKASGDAGAEMSSQHLSSDHNGDKRIPADPQVPLGPHEYFQGQFPHPMFPQWPIHSPPGAPAFQPYPMAGMPYYQNYPGSSPFFQSPYTPMEDPRFNPQQRMGLKRHSMDSKDSHAESETWEMGISSTRSQDGADQNMSELEKEVSQGRESRRKGGRSGKKRSGMVVIRNINYITSKRHNTSGSESQSASNSETEEESEDLHSDAPERKHKKSSRSSKSKISHTKSIETSNLYDKEEVAYGQEADSGNWQAFQSFLLRDEESKNAADKGMFSGEKEPPVKRRQNKTMPDPILPPERDYGDVPDRTVDFDAVNGKATRMNKHMAIHDEQFHSNEGRGLRDGKLDVQFEEIEGGGGGYRRATSEDFMIYGRENQFNSKRSLDPLAENEYECAGNLDKSSPYNVTDESFVVPVRSGSQEQHGTDSRIAIDMDLEFPSALQKAEDSSNMTRNQLSYEPDDLSVMPERGMERESIGYDPALDYDMQVRFEDAVAIGNGKQDVSVGTKEGLKKSDKEKKSRTVQDGLEKRKTDALMRKGKPSKLNPLAEAQARAEKLRTFKADLQKEKKEKEEDAIKRLESLKRERQKRIAARGSSSAAQSPLTPQQNRIRLPTKLSPSSHRGSKFSDSEPGSSSPLQKLPVRRNSVGSSDSQKIARSSRQNGSNYLVGNGLSRSVSSLPELKKESNGLTTEPKTASIQTRRLSDPKVNNVHRASSLKSSSSDKVPKQNASGPKASNIHRGSSLKSVSRDQVTKQNLSDEPQIKKISAIMNLDKSKSATLPELKIKTSRGPSDTIQNKSTAKEAAQKGNGSKSSLSSENIKMKKTNGKLRQLSNGDDNLVVDKTVVMLEHENVSVPVVKDSEEMIERRNEMHRGETGVKSEVVSEYAAIRDPASPIIICEVEKEPDESYVVAIDSPEHDSLKLNPSITDKPYQAPYARATSLEEPHTNNLEYTDAPSTISSETALTGTETFKAHVSKFAESSSVEQIHETFEKSRGKESSKGFRRLLKFGRKSNGLASGEPNQDSDSSSVDDHTVAVASSSEVHMLKNLISQDDTHVGGIPPKVSRPFSILSPFRNRTGEKKLAV